MDDHESTRLDQVPEEIITSICSYFFAEPLLIVPPYPPLSCITCSDYKTIISLLHVNSKLRNLIRNNTDLWSSCLFRYPCFLNGSGPIKTEGKFLLRCAKEFANVSLPNYKKFTAKKSNFRMYSKEKENEVDEDEELDEVSGTKIVKMEEEEEREPTEQEIENEDHCKCSKYHFYSNEEQLLDLYSQFVNLFCDTSNMTIYLEGVGPLPSSIYKQKPADPQFMLRKYIQYFPHVRCVSLAYQRDYVESKYWFNGCAKFSAELMWNDLEGVYFNSSDEMDNINEMFDEKKSTLQKITSFFGKKETQTVDTGALKRVNFSMNLLTGKSHLIYDYLEEMTQTYPNIDFYCTIFASDVNSLKGIGKYLKRLTLTVDEASENAVTFNNLKLPNLSWLDLSFSKTPYYSIDESKPPILQKIVFEDVEAPLLSHLSFYCCEVDTSNQKLYHFKSLEKFTFKKTTIDKNFWFNRHANTLKTVEIYNHKDPNDYTFDDQFVKLNSITTTGVHGIYLHGLRKLSRVNTSKGDTLELRNCPSLSQVTFYEIQSSVIIDHSGYSAEVISCYSNAPPNLMIQTSYCKTLTLPITGGETSYWEVSVKRVTEMRIQISSSFNMGISQNVVLIHPGTEIETLELNGTVTQTKQGEIESVLRQNINNAKSITKFFLNMIGTLHSPALFMVRDRIQELGLETIEISVSVSGVTGASVTPKTRLSLSQEGAFNEAINVPGLKIEELFSCPHLFSLSLWLYRTEKFDLPKVQSSSLKDFTMNGSNREGFYHPLELEFSQLKQLEKIKVDYMEKLNIVALEDVVPLQDIVVTKTRQVEIDLSLLPKLKSLVIKTCGNVKLINSKNIPLQLVKLTIRNVHQLTLDLSNMNQLKELSITKIRNYNPEFNVDTSHCKQLMLSIVHLPNKK